MSLGMANPSPLSPSSKKPAVWPKIKNKQGRDKETKIGNKRAFSESPGLLGYTQNCWVGIAERGCSKKDYQARR